MSRNSEKQSIPKDVQKQVEKTILDFNQKNFSNPAYGYQARFKGKYLYLDRADMGVSQEVCRLTYNGKMRNWDFAIYLHSRNRYDPEEWLFPGSEKFDGSVESAMETGLIAYPVTRDSIFGKIFRGIFRLLYRR